MTTLTQTLPLTYTNTPNLISIKRFSLCTGLIINGIGCEMSRGIVLEEYTGERSVGVLVGMPGVNIRILSRVPEWHKRNLVTL